MSAPTYPAARVVADRIHAHLDKDLPTPDASVIEEIISAAFWASLRREEGRAPTISLAFVQPEQVYRPLTFATALALEPDVLVRLAPAVERPGIHLGVAPHENRLALWGTTRSVPTGCFVLEVIAPGLLVVKFRQEEPSTKFANIAVLDGATVKFIAQNNGFTADIPLNVVDALFRFYESGGREESGNALVRLATSIRAHQRGGTLLVVPAGSDAWRASMMKPLSYAIRSPLSEFEDLPSDSDDVLRGAIDSLAGWTAVDGATVMSDRLALLASGVKIVSRDTARRVGKVLVREPVEDAQRVIVEPSQLGNTRHVSAAQFVYDQHDALAMVASQDGRFTVFAWSKSEEMVHAYRLESLLL